MKKKMLLVAGVIAAAAITSVSFAAGNSGTTDITISNPQSSFADVKTVDNSSDFGYGYWSSQPSKTPPVKPSFSPTANTVGPVNSGDLYTISNIKGNLLVTLYLNNAGALSSDYSYLNLKVNVYSHTKDATTGNYTNWAQAANQSAQVLSLNNGYVTFDLPAISGEYGISVDDGSYYCTSIANSGGLAPSFYLTVQPSGS